MKGAGRGRRAAVAGRNPLRTAATTLLILVGVSGAAAADTPPSGASGSDLTIVHAGTLLAEPGAPPKLRQSIVVRGGRIESVEPDFVTRPGARIVNLESSFVLPGLIDSHVHLQFGGGDYRADFVALEDGGEALRAFVEAHRALEAGFTTIRDMAGSAGVVFSLRDAIRQGHVEGPRIFASGPAIIPTGGGILRGMGVRRDIADMLESRSMEVHCDGPSECTRVARRLIADGADHLKVIVSGSILEPKLGRQMTRAEIKAIVAAARGMGKTVSAAALERDGIAVALEAGVTTIEHGSLLDESSFPRFRRAGAYLVPTMMSVDKLRQRAETDANLNPVARANILAASDNLKAMLPRAYSAAVPILFGTDLNVGSLGLNGREFVLMHASGMSEMDVIRSATVSPAKVLGMESELGSIKPGMLADVIAVSGSPLDDIVNLTKVNFVMKAGQIVLPRSGL